MTTDDFLREQTERSQQQRTRRRREGRSRRRHVYLAGGVVAVAVLILGAPSIVSHSSIGRALLRRAAAGYGLEARAASVRVGWITPLRVTGLEVRGASGASHLNVERIDTELTVTDLVGSTPDDLGEIVLRGVLLDCAVADGRSSLEDDLSEFLNQPGDGGTGASIKLQDITVVIAESGNGSQWQIAQSSAEVVLEGGRTTATFAGVVSDPDGGGGSLQGKVDLASDHWQVDLETESMPLSIASLVRRRLSDLAETIPSRVSGDATGAISIHSGDAGEVRATLDQVQIRNLTATGQQSALWANQLATFDGELSLTSDRVIGRGLRATTDFATATIDGAFSRSFSFVGANDNPLRWLEGLEGSATAEIDLALLDRALPGLLPLKRDAQLVSGRAIGQLKSLPAEGGSRRSQLIVRSEELRARSQGRAVAIDPISLTAIVSTNEDHVAAEEFEWTSSFAKAVGRGDLRSGSATVDIDFGRLSTALRPIIDLSRTALAGTAKGNINWNASAARVWRLSGSGKATNLAITMPSGETFRRPTIQSNIEAEGRWGGKTLEELTSASITLVSTGLDLRADLIQPVKRPSRALAMPVQLQGSGRVETLVETLSPWLPVALNDAEGGFTLNAQGDVSASAQRLRVATIELTMPRLAYAQRSFGQPNVKIHFDGEISPSTGRYESRSLTILSDAFSAAVRGTAGPEKTDLHVDWKANLERIQGSVRKQVASRPGSAVRQVGYRPGETVKADEWLLMGDCQGELEIVTQGKTLQLDALINATDVAVVQPSKASAGSQTVGPMPRRPRATASAPSGRGARVVWSEPNLRIDGMVNLDRTTGRLTTESVNVAGDWFATDLNGHAVWNDSQADVRFNGPARLKMEQVASLLSQLAGTDIRAQGIQETPLEIRAGRKSDGGLAFSVAGNLGWEVSQVAGMTFGPATVPVRLTETSVDVSPTVIPVGNGQLNLAGKVHYRPGPLWMQVQPGVIARSVRLTPQMTNRWMKYVAPLVADATNVDGTLSASIDEAIVVFDQPELTHVEGQLNIEGARMTAGPLANQIISGIEQLKAIARATLPQPAAGNRTLITMPAQTVEFMVDSGVVSHKRLFFEVDRAQVVTSGRVGLNGRLDMDAMVPLDPRWLGSDLQGLAGQPVTLPIDGTLSRPSLDSRGVRQVVSQLGVQAVQSTAENYLQQQLNRGIDKIFGGGR